MNKTFFFLNLTFWCIKKIYILTSQSSIFVSQNFPTIPVGQEHVKDAILSIQVAPFEHGFELHSLISILQTLPKDKENYILTIRLYNIILK